MKFVWAISHKDVSAVIDAHAGKGDVCKVVRALYDRAVPTERVNPLLQAQYNSPIAIEMRR